MIYEMLFLGLEEIFSTSQPGIPRMLTALAEWSACAVVVLLMHWRLPKVQTLLLLAAGLPIQIMLRCFGSYAPSPYSHFFFYVGIVVNVAFMLFLISGLTKEPAPVCDILACRQLDIQLGYTADAKGLEALAPRDICILFGNLLDNAVEYVQSIAYTVENDDGTIQVQSEGGWFTASILLPVNPA